MIAQRVLPREEWTAQLKALGGKPLQGKTKLNTAEWWITPWKFVFTVPTEDEYGYCEIWAFETLLERVKRSRPASFKYED